MGGSACGPGAADCKLQTCQLTRHRQVKPAFEPQTRLTRQCPEKPD